MDKQRLLVIGARGFIGSYAVEAATNAGVFEVIRGDRTNTGGLGTVQLDITDESSVNRAFDEARPDCVLLLAAISDIDRCESLPEHAFATNARGAEYVAAACARSNARLLFTSTGAVFDGMKHGYREEDSMTPLSVYGRTKAWAEDVIRGLMPTAVIIRVALVLGFARTPDTSAVLDNLARKWKAREPVFFPARERRNPIDVASLGNILIDLISDRQLSGVYHVGALDSMTRYELGLHLARQMDVSLDLVREQQASVPGRAPRGEDHFLLTDKLRGVYKFDLGFSNQVIERCFP